MIDNDKIRRIIEARLQALGQRMVEIDTELDTPKPKDLEDQAQALESEEVLEGMAEAAELEARLLRSALSRLDDGSFGECLGCGTTISAARLEAVPYAVLCRDCAAKAETRR